LTNSGNAPLTGIGVRITGAAGADFSQVSTCGTKVDGGANCTISLTFTPTALDTRVATMIVTYTLAGAEHTASFNLSGVGQ